MEKKTEQTQLVMIDTSIFIDHLRGYSPAVNFFNSLRNNEERFIFSAITETELIAGKSCKNNEIRTTIINLLNQFEKIEVNNQIALLAGDISRDNGLSLPDAIIASSALVNKAKLFTGNLKDFNILESLKVESPY